MATPTVKSKNEYVRFEYTKGTSNKFYEINFTKSTGSVLEVSTCHGRIGSNPQYQTKYKGKSLAFARNTWSKFYNDKLKKGYGIKVEASGQNAAVKATGQPAKTATGLKKARKKALGKKKLAELRQDRFGGLEL